MTKIEKSAENGAAIGQRPLYRPYERFKAWAACHQVVVAVYRETATWPSAETAGLTAQARQAAFSAALSIADGSAKRARDFQRHVGLSLGSLSRLACILIIARDVGVMGLSAFGEVEALRDHASRLTLGLYRAVRRRGAGTETTLRPGL